MCDYSLGWFFNRFDRVFRGNWVLCWLRSILQSVVHFAEATITNHILTAICCNWSVCQLTSSDLFGLMDRFGSRNNIMIIVPRPLLLLYYFLWSWITETELFYNFSITSSIINISVSIWYSPVVTLVFWISWVSLCLHETLRRLLEWDSLCRWES